MWVSQVSSQIQSLEIFQIFLVSRVLILRIALCSYFPVYPIRLFYHMPIFDKCFINVP